MDALDRPLKVASGFSASFAATGADEILSVPLQNVSVWKALVSWTGVAEVIAGLVVLLIGCKVGRSAGACCNGWVLAGMLMISAGLLTQPGGASWFLLWVAFVLLIVVIHQVRTWPKRPKKPKKEKPTPPPVPESDPGE